MLNSDHLRTYFIAFGKALNASALEVSLHMPEKTIRHWLKGRRAIPDHHRPALEAWARRFGYNESTQYDQFL